MLRSYLLYPFSTFIFLILVLGSCQRDTSINNTGYELEKNRFLEILKQESLNEVSRAFVTDSLLQLAIWYEDIELSKELLTSYPTELLTEESAHFEAQIDYYRAKVAYLNLQHEAAEEYLNQVLNTYSEQLPLELLSQAFSLRCLLEFERQSDTDTLIHYASLADATLTPDAHPIAQIEVKLCNNMASYIQYDWDILRKEALLHRTRLLDQDLWIPNLEGMLSMMEAIAAKKLGDRLEDSLQQRQYWEEAKRILEPAINNLKEIDNGRWRLLSDELAYVISRFRNRAALEELLNTLERSGRYSDAPFGFPNKARGYFNYRYENKDSTLIFFQRFLQEEGSNVREFYLDEANWFSLQYHLLKKEFDQARSAAYYDIELYDCSDLPIDYVITEQKYDLIRHDYNCLYALSNYARVLLEEYKETFANSLLDEVLVISELIGENWDFFFRGGRDQSILFQVAEHGDKMIDLIIEANFLNHQRAPENSSTAEGLFNALELGRTLLLFRDLMSSRSIDQAEITIVDSLKSIRSQIQHLQGLYDYQYDEDEQRASLEKISQLRRAYDQQYAFWEAGRDASNFGENRFRTSLDELKSVLGPDKGFLEYGFTSKGVFALYIDQEQTVSYQLQIGVDSLNQLIDTLIYTLNDKDASDQDKDWFVNKSAVLKDVLIGPINEQIPELDELIISPDGSIQRFPFAALTKLEEKEFTYLVEDIDLRYVPSWQIERLNQKKRSTFAFDSATIVGIWTSPDLSHYDQIADSLLLYSQHPNSSHYEGTACNSNSFLTEARKYDIIHLSVHARGDVSTLNNNFLYFSRNDSLGGGLIGGLSQLQCSLAVLAACETSVGQSLEGEGPLSIQRKLHTIGIPDIAASLWRVPDSSTREFYKVFYIYLYNGLNPSEALNQTQRDYLKGKTNERWVWPGFWAGLVMG